MLMPPVFELTWDVWGSDVPDEIVADQFGNVFVLGLGDNVKVFTADGTPSGGWDIRANGAAVDSHGFVYLSVFHSQDQTLNVPGLYKYDLAGNRVENWGIPGAFGRMAIDTDDVLYVIGPPDHVQKYNTEGSMVGVIPIPFPAADIDVDRDGSIYLLSHIGRDEECNVAVSKLFRISPSGVVEASWGGWDTIGDEPGQLANVVGTAVSEGVLFVTDYRYDPVTSCEAIQDWRIHRMQAFDRDGNFLLEWGRLGNELEDGDFAEHLGADVDPLGDFLYIADSFHFRIQKWRVVRNEPPSCAGAYPSANRLWPPDHKLVPINILGVTDPEGDLVTIEITGITQDEPVRQQRYSEFDGSVAYLRAERDGKGDGRVYAVAFSANDSNGGTCSGEVLVVVPHDAGSQATNSGQYFNAIAPFVVMQGNGIEDEEHRILLPFVQNK